MKRKILLFCLVTAMLVIPLSSSNALSVFYYVSPTGSDSNPGTFDRPWRTLNYMGRKVVAGDTVFIRGGTYYEAVSILNSGTETNPISVFGYPGENVVIDGTNSIPGLGGSLLSLTGSFIYASDIEVRNSAYYGVYLGGKHDTVNNIYSHHNRENGILINGDYGSVMNSRIWRNALSNEYGLGNGWSSGLSAARDATDGVTDYAIMRNNIVWENWGEGISSYEANQVIIEDNVSYNNYATNVYLSDTTNVIFQRNFIYMTSSSYVYGKGANMGIMMGDERYKPASANIQIINNVLFGNKINIWWWPGVQGGGMNNVLISNNTLVNSYGGSGGVNFAYGQHQNVQFESNIVDEKDTVPVAVIAASPGLSFSNNFWSKMPPSTAVGQGDVIGDPKFSKTGILSVTLPALEDFKLLETSLAINKARKIAEVVNDIGKNLRDAYPDIGAYEYLGAAVSSPTPAPTGTNTPLPPAATNTPPLPTVTKSPLPPIATNTLVPTTVFTSTYTPIPATPIPPTPIPPTPTSAMTSTPARTSTTAPTLAPTKTFAPTATQVPPGNVAQVVAEFQDGVAPNKKYNGNKDATISQSVPDTNFGSAATLQVGGPDGSQQVILIQWDIVNVPAKKGITFGSMEINVSNANGQTYQIYQALRDWNDTQVTWNKAANGVNWQSPGASGPQDRGSVLLGTLAPAKDGTYKMKFNVDGVKLIQNWIRKSAPNYGFILVASSNANSLSLASSEGPTPALRPKLEVGTGN